MLYHFSKKIFCDKIEKRDFYNIIVAISGCFFDVIIVAISLCLDRDFCIYVFPIKIKWNHVIDPSSFF